MTDQEKDAIKYRCDAASPGPWDWTYDGSSDYSIGHKDDPQDRAWGVVWNQDHEEVKPNLEFCAHARTDIRTLLSEIERLEAEAARMNETLTAISHYKIDAVAALDQMNVLRHFSNIRDLAFQARKENSDWLESRDRRVRAEALRDLLGAVAELDPKVRDSLEVALRGAGEAGA